MFRNIIFDWSGTLCNDLPPVLDTINRILAHHGAEEIDEGTFRAEFRLPFGEFYDARIPGALHSDLEALYDSFFPISEKTAIPIPHAREFVEAMRSSGRRLFVLSAVTKSHFHEQAELLGFQDSFERLYLAVRDKRKVIHQILEENQLNPSETCFIGDMRHDVDTARHAGITSIAVLTGYDSAGKLAESDPNVMVSNLDQLADWFRRADPFIQMPINTVGALIFNSKGEILLLKTAKWINRWGIPGGKIKRGEGWKDALQREINEETGLEITDIRLSMIQDCVEPNEFVHSAHFLLLAFLAIAQSEQVQLNDEAEEWAWVNINESLAWDLNAPTRQLINHHLSNSSD